MGRKATYPREGGDRRVAEKVARLFFIAENSIHNVLPIEGGDEKEPSGNVLYQCINQKISSVYENPIAICVEKTVISLRTIDFLSDNLVDAYIV